MQIFDFGFWKVHARLSPVCFLGRFFVGVSSLSLIIYRLNLLVFVSTFVILWALNIFMYHHFLRGQFWIFRGTFLRKL